MTPRKKQDTHKILADLTQQRNELSEEVEKIRQNLEENLPQEAKKIRTLVASAREEIRTLDINNPEHKQHIEATTLRIKQELEQFKLKYGEMKLQEKAVKNVRDKLLISTEVSRRYLQAIEALKKFQLDNRAFVLETDKELRQKAQEKAEKSKEVADTLIRLIEETKKAYQQGTTLPPHPLEDD